MDTGMNTNFGNDSRLRKSSQHTVYQALWTSWAMLFYVLIGASLMAAAEQAPLVASQEAASRNALGYCKSSGGEIVYRQAIYGTNGDPSSWLVLAPIQGFCEYLSAKDGSTIGILLDTLTTTKPTLATLAYYSQLTPTKTPDGDNPASHYCSQLGGSDQFGGVGMAGGGWVNTAVRTQIRQTCVFPDSSAIDSFGLFYHSAGLINGVDLSTVLRYKAPLSK